ncbi:MAG: DUF1284 domain-containing protein [Acutalibacteraceae bacterium]|jgi:hypothetical protein
MSVFSIRPHHLLCLTFFEGKGYDDAFVSQMSAVHRALNGGDAAVIAAGADDICAACPHNRDGVCDTEDKVRRYDAAVTALCALSPGEQRSWSQWRTLADQRILRPGRLKEICGDCEWAGVCAAKAKERPLLGRADS